MISAFGVDHGIDKAERWHPNLDRAGKKTPKPPGWRGIEHETEELKESMIAHHKMNQDPKKYRAGASRKGMLIAIKGSHDARAIKGLRL